MATPDTSTLTSSAQVFTNHTLPQIRAIHKSLHVQIDEKAARLRTQVGNSYRELLGTADTIVQMRHDMTDVQNILGRMGGMCGRTVVGGKVAGLGNFRGVEENEARMGQVARLRLLEACGHAVSRLLKRGEEKGRGDRLLLAAKVLVLSRLLASSFTELKGLDRELSVAIEAAKKRVGGLRDRLRRGIDKVLDKLSSGVGQGDILKVLCAYSLASSYGARDVLRHFLNVRAEAMAFEFDVEERERERASESVLKGLDLYTKTILDVQALVPGKLFEALANLKKQPLLTDNSLKSLEGLRLDTYERWCGDEIQYFTPFIRHDDLDGKQAKEMLTAWVKQGGETLLQGLSKTLDHMGEFATIVELRTSVLQHWVRDGGKAKGFDPTVVLNGLRSAFSMRLQKVLDTKVSKLRLIGSEVAATLETWQDGVTDTYKSLWDDEMLDMDVSIGSSLMTNEVLSRLHGKNDAVSRAVTSYESWYGLIDDVNEIVEQLRRQRWDNDLEEIEDEETIEVRQKLLSKDDPQKIDDQLRKALEQAYQALDEQLGSLWMKYQDAPNNGRIAMYLLRILRSIRSRLPDISSTKTFGLEKVPSLQEKVAAQVVVEPLEEFARSALSRTRVVGRSLWEGEPALPSHPSPDSFKLLRNLVAAMGDAGLDLWSPSAVLVLKQAFGSRLGDAWGAKLEDVMKAQDTKTVAEKTEKMVEKSEDQDEKDEMADEAKESKEESSAAEEHKQPAPANDVDARDLLIQWTYDMHILQVYLGTPQAPNERLKSLTDKAFSKTELSTADKERMAKLSQEYWKRTSLLFGLLE
ncbi:oligomeric Golgi complex component [Xylariales sp. PMI_506]|nr:oligomeric Golgi complex component [Xylariales sp. PMI_506]